MDLLEIWNLARRSWLTLVASVLVGIGVGAGISSLQPELYSATTTGQVVTGASGTESNALSPKDLAALKASTYVPLAGSRLVTEGVAEKLGIPVGEVTLTAANNGVIFTVTSTARSPQLAKDMADAGIRATSIAANDLETMTIEGKSTGEEIVRIVPLEPAQAPTRPVSPNWRRNLALGAALGLLGGFAVVVLRRTLDHRVRLTSEVEEITGSAALAAIPIARELEENVSLARSSGAAAEALRKLRTNLRYVSVDSPARVVVVTSANEGEGKSTIAAQLAGLLAEAGEPTVLVDADLRRPRAAEILDVDGAVGLTQVLSGALALDEALIQTGQSNLMLLPAGRIPPNPSELVGSRRMQQLLASLRETRMVVVDAPPLLPVTDAGLLTAAADGALLVVQHGTTRKEQIALAARNLDNVNAALLGFVMNKVPAKDFGMTVYGYGYGGSHSHGYYGDGTRRAAATPGRRST